MHNSLSQPVEEVDLEVLVMLEFLSEYVPSEAFTSVGVVTDVPGLGLCPRSSASRRPKLREVIPMVRMKSLVIEGFAANGVVVTVKMTHDPLEVRSLSTWSNHACLHYQCGRWSLRRWRNS